MFMRFRSQLPVLVVSLVLLLALSTIALAEGPQRGGILRVAGTDESASMDPLFGNKVVSDRMIYNLFYETLIRQEIDGSYSALLAEDWEIAADSLSITFKLRHGIVFHDGTPFNAAAVAFNLSRVIDPAVGSPKAAELKDVHNVEVLDDYTVRVNLAVPSAPIVLNSLAYEPGMMVSPAAVQELGDDLHRRAVGTGPMVFAEWRSGEYIRAKAFPDYWRAGIDGKPLPYVDEVDYRFILEHAVKLIELRTGNVHMINDVTIDDHDMIRREKDLILESWPMDASKYVAFNLTREPFNNENLRKAFAYAIDREELVELISLGQGAVHPTLVSSLSWIYDNSLPGYDYDPELARQLLKEAGYEQGIEVTLSVINRYPDTQIAELMQVQLAEVGITLKVEFLERLAWIEKVTNYNYDLASLALSGVRRDPDATFSYTFGAGAPQDWSGITSRPAEESAELWEVIAQATQVTDREERKDLYRRAQEILLERSYYMFLYTDPMAFAFNAKKVHNVTCDYASTSWRLPEVWLSE